MQWVLLIKDDDLSNTNDGTNPELSSDDDINDDREGTPGTEDNPNDEDDYDPAFVDVDCVLMPVCRAIPNLTISLDANGSATITADQIDNGSTVTCDGATLSLALDNSTFDCNDLGSGNIVNLTVTDSEGNTSTNDCETTVTVIDEIDPTVTCAPVTTSLDGNGVPIIVLNSMVVTSAGDNCTVVDTTLDMSMIDLGTIDCTPQDAIIVVTDQSGKHRVLHFSL